MEHQEVIDNNLKEGKITITVKDGDDKTWKSGFANYLMDNYKYVNIRGGFKAFINKRNEV